MSFTRRSDCPTVANCKQSAVRYVSNHSVFGCNALIFGSYVMYSGNVYIMKIIFTDYKKQIQIIKIFILYAYRTEVYIDAKMSCLTSVVIY